MKIKDCPLCEPKGEKVIAEKEKFRIIRVEDDEFPGYYRVIWNDHIKEMSDLSAQDRALLWEALDRVEREMIRALAPVKINLAQFGTMVPHLHWHLIARYEDDAAFPDSYWSARRRKTPEAVLRERRQAVLACDEAIRQVFSAQTA